MNPTTNRLLFRIGICLALFFGRQAVLAQEKTEPQKTEVPERIILPGVGRLPAFSHATITGDLIFVSGTLGTKPGTIELVAGGVSAQTTQTLKNIEQILAAAGVGMNDIAKCNVYLTDMNKFAEMNEAYLKFFTGAPPARTTVGVASLALGAAVEIECVAQRRKPQTNKTARANPIEWKTGFVTSGKERVYYETAGSGEPLVLCHGLGGNHVAWYQQVATLAKTYQVITWDQRGFGRSTNAAGEAGPAAAVKDLAALLDHLKIDRAHLVGQSMGGWAVLGFALAHPERVRSLTLASTTGGIFTPDIEREMDKYLQTVFAAPPPQAIPLGVHPAIGAKLRERDPARALLYQQLQTLGEAFPAKMPLLLRQTAYPHEAIRKLDLPVLFLFGSEDTVFAPYLIRQAAALTPKARVVEIPGAGHSPYFEEPDAWNAALLEFLSSSGSNAAK
jgi:2-succinyl-6-hydroxy-2,4-cyclohexadiene-1-carboxylate synthase